MDHRDTHISIQTPVCNPENFNSVEALVDDTEMAQFEALPFQSIEEIEALEAAFASLSLEASEDEVKHVIVEALMPFDLEIIEDEEKKSLH